MDDAEWYWWTWYFDIYRITNTYMFHDVFIYVYMWHEIIEIFWVWSVEGAQGMRRKNENIEIHHRYFVLKGSHQLGSHPLEV